MTQALYFSQPFLLKICQTAQVPCIALFYCYKTYDIIILPELDRIDNVVRVPGDPQLKQNLQFLMNLVNIK